LATIRRVVLGVDADLLDAVVTAWVTARASRHRSGGDLMCVAVDPKSARGARRADGRPVHLVAAAPHTTGVVRGQVAVDAKSNEITAFEPLLDRLDLTGVVVTADAMHTQDAHARYLHRRGAHYVLIAKANRPTLVRELTALPWADVQVAATSREHRSRAGRDPYDQSRAATAAAVVPPRPPGDPPATPTPRPRREGPGRDRLRSHRPRLRQASAAQLAQVIRGHWTIENQVHHVRDVTYDEDRSQTRTGASAQVMATFRNVAISLHRLAGATTIAQGTRAIMRRPERIWPLIT
jgi:predicted transposase YbfD/YdcC